MRAVLCVAAVLLCLAALAAGVARAETLSERLLVSGSYGLVAPANGPPTIANSALVASLEAMGENSASLAGSIPSWLSLLSALTQIEVCCNELTSSLPSELAFLSKLASFVAHENQLTGALPPEYGLLTQLTDFTVGDADQQLPANDLHGRVPTQWGAWKQLIKFDVDMNSKLTGPLPAFLADLPNLQYLWLGSTSFCRPCDMTSDAAQARCESLSGSCGVQSDCNTCTITDWLRNTGFLDSSLATTPKGQAAGQIACTRGTTSNPHVYFYLTGTLPAVLFEQAWTDLNGIFCGHQTKLSGTLPLTLARHTKLRNLRIYDAKLSGTLPSQFSSLTLLKALSLENNKLTGS